MKTPIPPTLNFKTKTLECHPCGTKEKLELPDQLAAVGQKLKRFAHVHRNCVTTPLPRKP